MKSNFRTWKKGKYWLYSATTLALLAGGVVTSTLVSQVTISAIANGTQTGNVGGVPIISTGIRNMASAEFQALVDDVVKDVNTDNIRYVVSHVGWTPQSEVVGEGVHTLGTNPSNSLRKVLKTDGFVDSDKGVYMVSPGHSIMVTNVGHVKDLKTDTMIPVHLEITYIDSNHGADLMPTSHPDYKKIGMFAKGQSGVVTLGFTNIAVEGATGGHGQTESGGGGGGAYTGRANGFIDDIIFRTTLINANTGERLENNQTVMAMKVSDVDATQLAEVSSLEQGTFAYIVSNNTKLQQTGGGFVSTSNGAINEDTMELSENSYIILRSGNDSTIRFGYTDGKRNHLDIVAGLFGNAGFELNLDKTGTIIIEKDGELSKKAMWNNRYSLENNTFKITNKRTGVSVEANTDSTGRAVVSDLPFDTYIVEEIKSSNGFAKTFVTQEVTISEDTPKSLVKGKEDQTVKITGTNKEITGKTSLIKRDKDTNENAQGKATLKTAQYQLFNADTNEPVKWTDTSSPQLLVGEKVTSSQVNGKTVEHGDNIVIDVDDDKLEVSVGKLAIGHYYWQEINAPIGYAIDGNKHYFTIDKVDDTTQEVVAETKQSLEQVIKARVSLQKLLQASGDLNASGYNDITFKFTPINDTKAQEKTVITSAKDEEDGSASVELEYGDWKLEEVEAPQGYKKIEPIYIHMTTDDKTDVVTITASHNEDGSNPFSKRTFSQSDDSTDKNMNITGALSGVVSSSQTFISLSRLTLKNNPLPQDDDDFQPHKFVLSKGDFDITGTKLLDDDNELDDRFADTQNNPYVDKKDNNEVENINTDTLKRGDTIFYQVWLDTTQFEQEDKVSVLGIKDKFDNYFVPKGVEHVKVYDKQTGQDVTQYFDMAIDNQELSVSVNDSGKVNGIVDTSKVPFGRYYVIVLEGTVAQETVDNTDIVNVAEQFVKFFDEKNPNDDTPPTTKTTEKRVNKVVSEQTPPQPNKPTSSLPKTGTTSFVALVGLGISFVIGALAIFRKAKKG